MLLAWLDFLKGISQEQGSGGGDMAPTARGERNPLQVCGWGRLGLGGQLLKPYCTPGFSGHSYCGLLESGQTEWSLRDDI